MRFFQTFFLLIGCLAIFSGSCKNKPKASSLEVYIFVRYSQDNGDMKSEVRFKNAQGALESLAEPPALNESPMRKLNLQGATYSLADKKKFQEKNTLTWTDLNGDAQTFTFKVGSIADFSFNTEKLAIGKEATIVWDGVQKIKETDQLVFLWEKEGQTVTMDAVGPTSSNSMTIPTIEMQRLSAGTWSLYLVYKQRYAQLSPLKASLSYEFYSPTRTFELY